MSAVGTVQEELMQRLLARRLGAAAVPEIPRQAPGARVPLSAAQARIWFFSRLFPESNEYNCFGVTRFDVAPNEAELRAALRTLFRRHDALRLRVFEVDGEPVQEDTGVVEPILTWNDLRALDGDEAERRFQHIGNALLRHRFRLDEAPLFRVEAAVMPDGTGRLVGVTHHVATDLLSWNQVVAELHDLIDGRDGGEGPDAPAPVRFIDYVAWQNASVDDRRIASELDYWATKLGGELPVLDLPTDKPRPASPTRAGHGTLITSPAAVIDPLRRVAEQEGTTAFVALLAAHHVFLHRLTGQDDVVVGTAFAGRDHPACERLVGCFLKPMALRTQADRTLSYREVVRRVHTTVAEAHDNQSVPFERIVAELGVPREVSVHPVFQNYFGASTAEDAWKVEDMFLDDYGAAKWDLTVIVTESPAGVSGLMDCSADLFEQATLERFAAMYMRLLEALAADPDAPVGTHRLIDEAERSRVVAGLNPYVRPQVPYRTLAEPFEQQVLRTPDAVALAATDDDHDDDTTLTYRQLNERANRLAHFLREAGAGPDAPVALCLERSFDLVVAVYAAAKAGAAYVPIEPDLPDARVSFMLDDTAPRVVVAGPTTQGRVPTGPWRTVDIEADRHLWADRPAGDVAVDRSPGALAYLLYTSGSTGRPKAVAYPTDGAIQNIVWLQRHHPFGPGDANILKTSYGFDVSTWELFWPLYHGARLVVCRPGGHRDPAYLAEMVDRHQVTTIFLVPTMMQVFLDELPAGSGRSLRVALCGGEPVTPRIRDLAHARLDATLVNVYGPTEAGTVTFTELPPDEGNQVVPLGRPADNFRLYVLDDDLDPVPVGVRGEAYIAGEVGLAHGYHRRPDLTADRFLPDPFGPPGTRMYRTGDICRYRDDGMAEHLGRADDQVKVRGLRIELAEVAAVLSEHPTVDDAVVLAVDEGDRPLVGWVVPAGGHPLDAAALAELFTHTRRLLPAHMVPASLVPVDAVPATVNGKVDRAALLEAWRAAAPDGAAAGATAERTPPATDEEADLARVFAEVLSLPSVGVTDSFFDLGGHSLLVFKLIAACGRDLGVRPSVADVFGAPTVRELTARLHTTTVAGETCLVPLTPRPGSPVLAVVHGGGGSALPFFEVARHLDGFSTYALQATEGPDEKESPTIEQMAARYVDAVDAVRGFGPLVIAGWSMGGCIALEMARQWRRRGTDPAAVVLVDTWAPPTVVDPALAGRARGHLARIDQLALDAIDAAAGDAAPSGADRDRLRRTLARNREAFVAYRPEPFDGQVDVLAAREPFPDPTVWFPEPYLRPDRGWSACLAQVSTRPVPGDHFSLVSAEHARDLAAVLQAVVDDRMAFAEV